MTDWSSADMRRLQDDAKKRVMEMKERSRYAADAMNLQIDDKKDAEPYKTPRFIKMPVELPEKQPVKEVTAQKDSLKQEAPAAGEKKQERKEKSPSALIRNIFGNLSSDDLERMFILSLCLLLSYEQTDEEVILALMVLL